MLRVHGLGLAHQAEVPAAEIDMFVSDAVQIHRYPDAPASKIEAVLQHFLEILILLSPQITPNSGYMDHVCTG